MATWITLLLGTSLLGQAPSAPVERRLQPADIAASSFLWNSWNKFQENYHPNYIADDDPKTAWIEGVEGSGTGEEIRITFSSLPNVTALRLRIRNGYQKRKDLFHANASVLKATVKVLPSQASFPVTLKDAMGWQDVKVALPAQAVSGFALVVDAVREGKVYKDLCISDLQIFVTSPAPENPKFEQKRFEKLQAWKAERVAAAKLFAKTAGKALPIASTYNLESRAEGVDISKEVHAALPAEVVRELDEGATPVDLKIELTRRDALPRLDAMRFYEAKLPAAIADEMAPSTTPEEECAERCKDNCDEEAKKKACLRTCEKDCLEEFRSEELEYQRAEEPRNLAMPNPPLVAVFDTAWIAVGEGKGITPENLKGYHEANEEDEFDTSGDACNHEYAFRGVLRKDGDAPARLARLEVHQCSELETRAYKDISIDVMNLYYDRAGHLVFVEWPSPGHATVFRWAKRSNDSWYIESAISFDGELNKRLVFQAGPEKPSTAKSE